MGLLTLRVISGVPEVTPGSQRVIQAPAGSWRVNAILDLKSIAEGEEGSSATVGRETLPVPKVVSDW